MAGFFPAKLGQAGVRSQGQDRDFPVKCGGFRVGMLEGCNKNVTNIMIIFIIVINMAIMFGTIANAPLANMVTLPQTTS